MSTVESAATTVPAQPDRRPARKAATLDTRRPAADEKQRVGEICPTCFMAKSLAGTCDTCD
ncbi:hypothetical protein [Nocardioides jejuensis]|uniref:Uncharacterized protein n=1 Tax=Nocardioides jejuensis TaxID=2502782 RepID=A0A4R1BWB9_9ACTN|nr:hypothetical protein [Nocardioides jejuensis]TCJ21535.1 hypothetical protein EPD65_14925 [Nocardioides jejuensis]